MKNVIKHTAVILAALLVTLGIPSLFYVDYSSLFGNKTTDAVSMATMELPEQPSGNFVVLVNEARHGATLDDWENFFTDKPVGVIMEDIECLVANSDASGKQLAERYQARLAANQMKVKSENGLLMVSKAECGLFDVIILSQELAEAYDFFTVYDNDRVKVIYVGEEV